MVRIGNAGGIFGLCIVYPMDTVKTRLQTHPGVYSGTLDCFKTMSKQVGSAMSFPKNSIFPTRSQLYLDLHLSGG